MKVKLLSAITLFVMLTWTVTLLAQDSPFGASSTSGFGKVKSSAKGLNVEPIQIWVCMDFVEMERKDFLNIEKELGFSLDPIYGKVMLIPDEKKKLMEAIEKVPSAEFLGSASVMTEPGVQAQTQLTEQIRFVTENIEYKETKKGDETEKEPIMITGIEAREIGVSITVTSAISADGKIIMLTMFPEVNVFKGWVKLDASAVKQPLFASYNMTTTVYLKDGMTFVTKGIPNSSIKRLQVIEQDAKPVKEDPKISLIICSGKIVPIKTEKTK